ncbi:MAG: hypothetical protein IPM82_27220 [Saprospiraceae bacterium]|nr:hypothetical protein [Saprospiraceae bacterium]
MSINDWFNVQSDSYEYDDLQRLSAKETVHHFQRQKRALSILITLISKMKAFAHWRQVNFWDIHTIIFWWTAKMSLLQRRRMAAPYIPSQFMLQICRPNPTTRFAQIQLESEVSGAGVRRYGKARAVAER